MKKIMLNAFASVVLGLSGAAHATVIALKFSLSGAQEVTQPGDPDGTGTAMLILDDVTNSAQWHITAQNIDPTVLIQVHRAPAGVAGPTVLDLNNLLDGTVNDPVVDEIVQDPTQFYLNLFNAAHPAGAIRGQFAVAPSNLAFQFPLNGVQQVSFGGVPNGDPDGTGFATLVFDDVENSVMWHITAQNIAPVTFVSTHIGLPGVNGPVVMNLQLLDGFAVDPEVDAIIQDPAKYYVRLANADFPAGAIRGQFVGGQDVPGVPGVPAPATLVLLGLGLAGLGWSRRRRSRRRSTNVPVLPAARLYQHQVRGEGLEAADCLVAR